MNRPKAIGIDLGTTFSSVGVVDETGQPRIVNNRMGEPLTPSVIYFGGEAPLVGEEAKAMQGAGEEDVASFFKRSMGNPNYEVAFEGRSYTATELSAILLKSLKADAEAELGTEVTQAVITVPAYFDDPQRKATIEAGKIAGLEVLRIINEPTAAAQAYGVHKKEGEQTVLVYDLGGGTFDVSLVRITNKSMIVIGTDGEHELGGKDWDERIAMYLGQKFSDDNGVNPLNDAIAYNDLMVSCEEAKKRLSGMDRARVSITYEGVKETYDLTRAEFNEMTKDLMERTQQLTEKVLAEQGMNWDHIDGVILVGGSTRMPMVREWVEEMSGKKPISGVNVDEAVALGAAIEAGVASAERMGFTLPGVKEKIDVMSHSLGLIAENEDRSRYINSIIIPRNRAIPCTETRPYQLLTAPGKRNQLEVYMLQGESEIPLNCVILGRYIFSGITHVTGKPAEIEVEYAYDQNGMVTVNATEYSTRKSLSMSVENVPDDMTWVEKPPADARKDATSPYTIYAGQQSIPGVISDHFGNPLGNEYDLAGDNSFEGYLIAVLHLYTREGFDFRLPTSALGEKGFVIHRWTSVPRIKKFKDILEKSSQLWIISDDSIHLTEKHIRTIEKFFNSGRGLYVWGDNDPFFADANYIINRLFGVNMSGNVMGNHVIGVRDLNSSSGFASHLITTGIEHLYEGITIATISLSTEIEALMYGSAGNVVIAVYDRDGKRAIIDGGFTRLFVNWDTAGTGRYVKNAASWLVNYERFGYQK